MIDARSRMVEKAGRRITIVARVAPEFDRSQVFDVLVAVVAGGHESHGSSVGDRERSAVEGVGEQDVVIERAEVVQ